jgi:hypothetical protein
MLRIASLVAATGFAAAWDLTLSANETWVGNDHAPAGGLFTFDNSAGGWNNATGTCTVSAGGAVSFLSGSGLFTIPYAGGDSYAFADLSAEDRDTVEFLFYTELNGDAPGSDFLSVSCSEGSAANDILVRNFPSHPEASAMRGSVRSQSGDWGNFVLTFAPGVAPANLTFDDPNVAVGEELNGAVTIDASGAVSDELWFGADWTGDARMAGSWQMSADQTV